MTYIKNKEEILKANRSNLIRKLSISIFSPRRDYTSDDTVNDTNKEEEIEASGLSKADRNNLVVRLELLIPETKADHDGLYDEMFKKNLSNYYL